MRATPGARTSKISPTLPKVSAMKRATSDNPSLTLNDSKENVQSEYKEEANAITDRAHLNSDKVSGGEFTLSEEIVNEESPDPAAQPNQN